MPTGAQIRQAIIDHRGRPLAARFRASANGTATTVIDAVHLRGDTLGADYFGGEAWLYFPSGSSQPGGIAKLDQFSGLSGAITFSPALGGSTATGDAFEVWMKHHPLEVLKAIDRALQYKCKDWRRRPLSVLAYVENWATSAYDQTAGGVSNATATKQTLDFPQQYQGSALRVTNTGANGYCSSEAFGVQPAQVYRVFGWARALAQTGSIRVRDLTHGADIAVQGTATFSLLGWVYLDFLVTIPAGCEKVQLWLGGADAAFVGDFAGIGFLETSATAFSLPSTVRGTDEVGRVYERTGAAFVSAVQSADDPALNEIGAWRKTRAGRVDLSFPRPPALQYGVYVELAHHYDALWVDYYTANARATGDAATTDCPLEYIEAAAVVELLAGTTDDALKTQFVKAAGELDAIERRLGPEPIVLAEPSRRPLFRRSRI
ncbi:MAG TPA: hypothetical protein VFC53_01520 [Dehalococcoidia bacterium]|nr:hypothetical protein [Dehalococcoidia bacterium]